MPLSNPPVAVPLVALAFFIAAANVAGQAPFGSSIVDAWYMAANVTTPTSLVYFQGLPGEVQRNIKANSSLYASLDGIRFLIQENSTLSPIGVPDKYKESPYVELLSAAVQFYQVAYTPVDTAWRSGWTSRLAALGVEGTATINQLAKLPLVDSAGNLLSEGATAYAGAFLDLTAPLVLTVPPQNVWFSVSLFDYYQNSSGTIGTDYNDTAGGKYLIAGPRFRGSTTGYKAVLRTATNDAVLAIRVLIPDKSSLSDVSYVAALLDNYTLTPVASTNYPFQFTVLNTYASYSNPSDPLYFWKIAGTVLPRNPPLPRLVDPLRSYVSQLGFDADFSFNQSALSNDTALILELAIPIAQQSQLVASYYTGTRYTNYWYLPTNLANFGDAWLHNAATLKYIWMTNALADAAYYHNFFDSEGAPLSGNSTYVLKFTTSIPTKSWWSVQALDLTALDLYGYNVISELSSNQFLYNGTDGSITFTFAPTQPEGRYVNWLETNTSKPFFIVFSVYSPQEAVVNNTYILPPIFKLA